MRGIRVLLYLAALLSSAHSPAAEGAVDLAFRDPRFFGGTGNGNGCPPCELLFGKLKHTEGGKRTQHVEIQERGEPKSGTGFMLEWAGGALTNTCTYLKKIFGERSCKVWWTLSTDVLHDLKYMNMTFEPDKESLSAACPCSSIDRVSISISGGGKHRLPTPHNCRVDHSSGIPTSHVCTFKDGSAPEDYIDLWHCVQEAACPIDDDRSQMVIFRDPRPLVVSAYFYLLALKRTKDTVDAYVAKMLPTYTKWVAVRYILFQGQMTEQSTFFWYDDAKADPLSWHHQWLTTAGLQLPEYVVEEMSEAVSRHEFGFPTKGVDPHPGSHANVTVRRSYEDEVTPQTRKNMDVILRRWLPPPLLAKFEVPLEVP